MHVAIVGAGLVGRVLAWRLNALDQSIKITLIDQNDRNFVGTGLVAAAMVAPYTEAISTEAVTQELGVKSYLLWKKWLPELEAQTASSVAFNQKGTIVVAHSQDAPDFQRFKIKAGAIISADKMQTINQDKLETLEPQLAENFTHGLYFNDEGVVDNQALYPALNQYFQQQENITVIENTKVDQLNNNGKLKGFDTPFDWVFDCRGNGASADLKRFRSVRGEVARVYAPEISISRAVRLIHPRYPLYIAPRKNHEYIIGATHIESDDDKPVSVRSGLELLSALYSLHQSFSEAQIIDLQVGLRPAFTNNQPRIEYDDKLIRINGLYRHGYLFSPTIINDLINNVRPLHESDDE
jgi:glycine oxidase